MQEPSFWMGDEAKNIPLTPEQIVDAEPLDRLWAYLIDAVIITIGSILCILPGLAYALLRDALYDGRSIGKKMMGLRVVNSDTNTPCKTNESLIRNISLMIPVFGVVDGVMVFIDEHHLRFGDKWAKTKVIKG
ncbi:MAG: RDD family protein [Acidobacteria bacterium]|nr:RDD family protein [Acidobacteriota bacterium]